MRNSTLASRAGYVDTQATLIRASLLAAHSVHADGFRAVDLRFYFRLFSNWLEQDILRPSQDLELTQIRRSLQALQTAGHCGQPLPKRFVLTEAGLLDTAEKLVDEASVAFEEMLFVLLFAASYRDVVRARVLGAARQIASSTRHRLGSILDPKRISRLAIRNAARLVGDLEQRIAADRALEEQMTKLLREGLSTSEVVKKLTDGGAYQLQRIKPYTELLLQVPEDLRTAELRSGIATRRQMLFQPLLARAQEELRQLQDLRM
ncbi:MAG TPA: hypothetical protein VH083_20715 [Myxococcales bacterium]|nr:hypothetical protein [Myxococcales bacterium]